jgi:hypothetical protein
MKMGLRLYDITSVIGLITLDLGEDADFIKPTMYFRNLPDLNSCINLQTRRITRRMSKGSCVIRITG